MSDTSYVCTLSEKLQQKAKDELNEDTATRDEAIVALRNKFTDRSDIKFRSDSAFLLRFLRAKKFDVDRAFKTMVKYYEVRRDYRDIFDNFLPSSAMPVWNDGVSHVLPDKDKEGRRVLLYRVGKWDPNKYPGFDCIRAILMCMEKLLEDEEVQINGIVFLGDYEGLSMTHLTNIGPSFARKTIDTIQNAFPMRFKASHYVNEPKLFEAAFAFFKPFLNDKLKKRVIFHGDDMDSLHSHVPVDILPSDYGGSKPTFDNTQWVQEMLASEKLFKDNNEYGLPPKRSLRTRLSNGSDDSNGGHDGSF